MAPTKSFIQMLQDSLSLSRLRMIREREQQLVQGYELDFDECESAAERIVTLLNGRIARL